MRSIGPPGKYHWVSTTSPPGSSLDQRENWVERAAWQESRPSEGACCQPTERTTERNQFLTALSSVCLVSAVLPILQTQLKSGGKTVHRGQPMGQSVGKAWTGILGQMEDISTLYPAPQIQATLTVHVNLSSPFFVPP